MGRKVRRSYAGVEKQLAEYSMDFPRSRRYVKDFLERETKGDFAKSTRERARASLERIEAVELLEEFG